ncbi:MAG: SH3 domain-containing protein [Steroidobacteraceae bacterium]
MKAVVIQSYQSPYENPISVAAGESVMPDFARRTRIDGWVWCTAGDGRSGWTPHEWLVESGGKWHLSHAFNAIELTVSLGEILDLSCEESGFFWAKKQNGEAGWVPSENVSILSVSQGDGKTHS